MELKTEDGYLNFGGFDEITTPHAVNLAKTHILGQLNYCGGNENGEK